MTFQHSPLVCHGQLLIEEADMLGRFDHPNIIKFLGWYLDNQSGVRYMLMELAEGGTLADLTPCVHITMH